MSYRFDRSAAAVGLVKDVLRGERFDHATYSVPAARPRGGPLHVYLGGDGLPWRSSAAMARDPTPREPFLLNLLALDPDGGIYLGRPCYHRVRSSDCHALLWTDLRYSEPVVESMAAAVRRVVERYEASQLMLIGYSGGGVLAMLVAERVVETDSVITIGANLDVEGWSELHGYSPLHGSLNPAARPALSKSIQQLHLVGGLDQVVPLELIAPTAERQPSARLEVMPEFDHVCCWERIWPEILASLASDRSGQDGRGHPTASQDEGLAAKVREALEAD